MKYPVSDRDFELEAKLDFIAFVSRIDRLRDRGALTQAERDALDSAFRLGGKKAAEALFEEIRTKTLDELRGFGYGEEFIGGEMPLHEEETLMARWCNTCRRVADEQLARAKARHRRRPR